MFRKRQNGNGKKQRTFIGLLIDMGTEEDDVGIF